jgi:hypothetical protein
MQMRCELRPWPRVISLIKLKLERINPCARQRAHNLMGFNSATSLGVLSGGRQATVAT